MKTAIATILFSACFSQIFAQNQVPQLKNLTASIDAGTKKYTLHFDVSDAENDSLRLVLGLSSDGGQQFDLSNLPMTGDVGFPIFSKNGAKIEVDLSSLPDPLPTNLTARLSAIDGQPIDFQSLVNEVDSIRLRDGLDFIEGKRHRTSSAAHLQEVRDSLKNFLGGQCFAVRDQPFTAFNNYTAHNIAGRHAGFLAPKKTVIVDAHYDTVSNSPGADDNGSGVVGTVEIARILGRFPMENTLQFSFFDLEESGLLGSAAYNANSNGVEPGEEILGAFNYEMIGFYSDVANSQTVPTGFNLIFPGPYSQLQANNFKGNFITNISNDISAGIETAFTAAATSYVPDLKVVTVHIPGNWQNAIYADLLRSDHVSFWQKNRPSIQLTDGANFRNMCYHTACDSAEMKLNFTFMANVVKATLAASAKMAGIKHGSWKAIDCPFPTPVGVKNAPESCTWLVYPNPASREIFLKTSDCPAKNISVEILDNTGKTVRKALFAAPFNNLEHISLVDLPAGNYFAKMNDGQNIHTEKIVIH